MIKSVKRNKRIKWKDSKYYRIDRRMKLRVMGYNEWLFEMSKEFQNRVLGKERADLFRKNHENL